MDNSITDKSKPYFVFLYSPQNQLKNKFKLVLKANTVKELKAQIQEKLVNKGQLEKDTLFCIKDKDDF